MLNALGLKNNTVNKYRFDQKTSDTINNAKIIAYGEDLEGNLWFGTFKDLHRFNRERNTFISYLHDPDDEGSISHNIIRSLFLDSRCDFWLGTQLGLNLYDPEYDREEFKRLIERDGAVWNYETNWTKRDGAPIYLRENARLVRNEAREAVKRFCWPRMKSRCVS